MKIGAAQRFEIWFSRHGSANNLLGQHMLMNKVRRDEKVRLRLIVRGRPVGQGSEELSVPTYPPVRLVSNKVLASTPYIMLLRTADLLCRNQCCVHCLNSTDNLPKSNRVVHFPKPDQLLLKS